MTTTNYPTKELTWQIRGNIAVGGAGYSEQDFIWKLKEVLIGNTGTDYPVALAHPWIVVSSSDAANAGVYAAVGDLWISSAVLANKGSQNSPHSWIVLEQPITGIQLLIACSRGDAIGYGTIAASCHNKFATDGTINNHPLATDMVYFAGQQGWAPFTNGTGHTGFLHVWHDASTGAHTRFAACYNGYVPMFATFDAVTLQTGAVLDSPSVCSYINSENGYATVPTFDNYKSNASVFGTKNAVVAAMYCACESWGGNVYPVQFTTAMPSTGAWCAAPITGLWWNVGGKLVMPSSAGASALPDILWGCNTIVNGSGYLNPDNGHRDWVQLGNLILPWDNTVIQTA